MFKAQLCALQLISVNGIVSRKAPLPLQPLSQHIPISFSTGAEIVLPRTFCLFSAGSPAAIRRRVAAGSDAI
jgi:hypothetical protein